MILSKAEEWMLVHISGVLVALGAIGDIVDVLEVFLNTS
jgi:hypothetical protein